MNIKIFILIVFSSFIHADSSTLIPVIVDSVKQMDVPIHIELVGSVVPSDSVHINTRIDSQVIKTHFEDGKIVQKNQLLFELDDRLIVSQVNELQAQLKKQEAELNRSHRQLSRDQSLSKSGFSSIQSYDKSQTDFQIAQADILFTKSQLENLKTQLSFCKIESPVTGVTGTINRTIGNVVKTNENNAPLVTIHTIQPIYVKTSLPQTNYAAFKTAMNNGYQISAVVYDADHNEMDEGIVQYYENTFDESSRTLPVYFTFPNFKKNLWPGMFVSILIKLGKERNALTVPSDAVKHGQNGPYVYIFQGGKAVYQTIKVRHLIDNKAIIDGPVTIGDIVIVDGHIRLKDQAAVKITNTLK